MIGCHRAGEPGLAEERGKSGIALVAGGDQPLHHIGAVEPLQRHDIADRRKCDDIQPLQQVDGQDALVAGRAQQPQRRDQHHEDDAGRAQMPLPREIVFAVRVDQRMARRQLVCHLGGDR